MQMRLTQDFESSNLFGNQKREQPYRRVTCLPKTDKRRLCLSALSDLEDLTKRN